MSGVNISICDGKYTVIQAPTGTTRVLRYGEEWRDVTGDNVIGGLAWELQEARDRIKRLEEENNELRAEEARLLNTNGELERRIHRASMAFFRDGSDGHVVSGMLAILEEERGKP